MICLAVSTGLNQLATASQGKLQYFLFNCGKLWNNGRRTLFCIYKINSEGHSKVNFKLKILKF